MAGLVPHDPPCGVCGHPWHLLECSDTCPCTRPPIPGIYPQEA